ncbi:hypothetical protein ANCCEY_04528 [Ancylostoma ceylanicum]|uniref:ATP-dependent DNA helicase n=1 Tax=Ancylostoma ceylanicum TaxID=53326 RepID=A0A0D6M955_9BILA|nr:hypothetical protein ANCCEY_04528 [Ancylostoma ceylanicum]
MKYLYTYVYNGHDSGRIRIQQGVVGQEQAIRGQEVQAVTVERNTKFTAWLQLNSLTEDAGQMCYNQIPEYYTWINEEKSDKHEKRRSRVVGRMFYVNPKELSMRLLLLNQNRATSFDDPKTINTYVEAAKAAGPMSDDSFRERSWMKLPSVCFCEQENPRHLWERFKKDVCEEFRSQRIQFQDSNSLVFHDIAVKTTLNGITLKDVLNINYETLSSAPNEVDNLAHKRKGELSYMKLNEDQGIVIDAFYQPTNGPGGTGKTFVYNNIYDLLTGKKKKSFA